MNLKNSSTALFVKDIEFSKQFYKEVLGLTVDLDFGKISDTSVNRFEFELY